MGPYGPAQAVIGDLRAGYRAGPLVARDTYGTVGLYGLLIVIYGAGMLLALLVAMVWHPRRPLRLALGSLWPPASVCAGCAVPRLSFPQGRGGSSYRESPCQSAGRGSIRSSK